MKFKVCGHVMDWAKDKSYGLLSIHDRGRMLRFNIDPLLKTPLKSIQRPIKDP